jgi:hypothetical protein
MNNSGEKLFSFFLNVIKETQKITDSEMEKYCSLLRNLVMSAKKLNDEEIDKINSGELSYQLFEKQRKGSSSKSSQLNLDVESLARELELCTSREQGEAILRTHCRLKDDLKALLRHLNIDFKSKDSKADLIEKIIENTINYRLRSQAIQNYGEDKK